MRKGISSCHNIIFSSFFEFKFKLLLLRFSVVVFVQLYFPSLSHPTKSGWRCLYSAILFQNIKYKLRNFEENLYLSHSDNTSEKSRQRFMSVMNLFNFVHSAEKNRPQCLPMLSPFCFLFFSHCEIWSSNNYIFLLPVLEEVLLELKWHHSKD